MNKQHLFFFICQIVSAGCLPRDVVVVGLFAQLGEFIRVLEQPVGFLSTRVKHDSYDKYLNLVENLNFTLTTTTTTAKIKWEFFSAK